jgi:hypothetical protein
MHSSAMRDDVSVAAGSRTPAQRAPLPAATSWVALTTANAAGSPAVATTGPAPTHAPRSRAAIGRRHRVGAAEAQGLAARSPAPRVAPARTAVIGATNVEAPLFHAQRYPTQPVNRSLAARLCGSEHAALYPPLCLRVAHRRRPHELRPNHPGRDGRRGHAASVR